MKHIKLFFGLTLCALLAATACQDSFDNPVLKAPQASKTPNSTILEVKEKYWNDANNYLDTIELTEAGEHVIISGRVISSDAAGNIYKSLVIQDKTAALAMSINANSMYNQYRIGQEIVIDLTDMMIGKYNGLQQLGFPDVYRDEWEATFMPLEFFKAHSELNGLPEPSKVDTITTTISDLGNDAAGQRKWQSQLVRFNKVHFQEADGKACFTDEQKVTANRTLVDENGSTIIVRNSGYANFCTQLLPYDNPKTADVNEGEGDVVGILSFYSNQWQLLLRSIDDCMNFGNPTLTPGTEDNPYSVDQAIELQNSGASGWVKGYIVGAVAPEVEEITANDQIEWEAPTTLANTLVIGATPDTKDIKSSLVIALPQDSKFREVGNLKDHPELLKREIQVLGRLETFMGVFGVTGNKGTTSEFKIEGIDPGGDPTTPGDGSKEKPYNVAQVQGGTATGTAWVTGYIVGWIDGKTISDGAKFTVPATVASNIMIAASADETDYNKCLPIQLPAGSVRAALNLQDNPANLGKAVKLHGSIEKYFGQTGVKSVDDYVLEGGDDPTPPTPVDPVSSINETFDGVTAISQLTGWSAQTVHGNKAWYFTTYQGNSYAACTAYKGTDSDGYESWLITPPIAVSKLADKVLHFESQSAYSGDSKLEVYVLSGADPTTATKTKLNATIAESPSSGYSDWVKSGDLDLSAFSDGVYIGWVYTSSSSSASKTICIDNVVVGTKSGDDPGPEPPVDEWTYADFNTFNGGKANSKYGTSDTFYSTDSGWKAVFSCILSGSAADPGSNPAFHFISSDPTVLAACMTGNKNNPGSIVSPKIPGGFSEMKFKYAIPYTDSKIQFKVTLYAVSSGGSLVKMLEETVTEDAPVKSNVYEYTFSGGTGTDVIVQFDNLCPSGATTNKDRVAIWDVKWK